MILAADSHGLQFRSCSFRKDVKSLLNISFEDIRWKWLLFSPLLWKPYWFPLRSKLSYFHRKLCEMALSRIADISALRIYVIRNTIYFVAYWLDNKWINQKSCIRNVFTTSKVFINNDLFYQIIPKTAINIDHRTVCKFSATVMSLAYIWSLW